MTQEEVQLLITTRDQASNLLGSIKNQILGIGAAYMTWSGVRSLISNIASAGIEAEKEMNNLRQAVERHIGPWKQFGGALESFSKQLMQTTGHSDELVMRGLQKLIDAGQDTTTAMHTMTVAADLAAGGQMDLMSASGLLAKAQMGATSMLGRYGIVLDESIPKAEKFAAALAQINARFGGAAEAQMRTVEGATRRLTNAWDEFLEEIYKSADAGDYLKLVITTVAITLEGLAGAISSGLVMFRAWYDGLAVIFREAGATIMNFGTVMQTVFTGNFSAAALSWNTFSTGLAQSATNVSTAVANATDKTLQHITSTSILFNQALMGGLLTTLDSARSVADAVVAEASQAFFDLRKTLAGFRADVSAELGPDFWRDTERQLMSESNAMMGEFSNNEMDRILNEQAVARNEAEQALIRSNAKMLGASSNYHQRMRDMAAKTYQEMTDMMSGWARAQIDSLVETGKLSADIFDQMAKDFMKFFIETSLAALANMFIPGLGTLLSSIFDTPRYDRMAMTQGQHFAQFFTSGALDHIRDNFIPQFAGSLSPQLAMPGGGGFQYGGFGGGSSSPMIVEVNLTLGNEIITKAITPKLVEDSRRGGNRLVITNQNLTGGAAEIF